MGGLNGGSGWGTNAWATGFSAGELTMAGTLTNGLTFSTCPVSGKAGVVSMTGHGWQAPVYVCASRKFAAAPNGGDTLWVSLLASFTRSGPTPYAITAVRTGTEAADGTIQVDIHPRDYDEPAHNAWEWGPSRMDGATTSNFYDNTDSGITYLYVAKVTNIAGAGSQTEKLWVLTAANWDELTAKDEEALNAHCVTTATQDTSGITLDTSKHLQLGTGHRDGGTTHLTVDEIRYGTTLTDVLEMPSTNIVLRAPLLIVR